MNRYYSLFVLGVLAAASAQATEFTTIYGFAGGGANPGGAPILGKDGAFYGVTPNSGAAYFGAVYRLVPPTTPGTLGTGSVVYSFAGGADGQAPIGTLLADSKGDLFGITFSGGSAGAGTVFELSPPSTPGGAWTKATLYQFTDGADGGFPKGGLTACGKLICGTTGGDYNIPGSYGTVFALTPPGKTHPAWALSTIYSFGGGADGGAPTARLLLGKGGTLYGTASGYLGGTGNVFSLTPPAAKGGAWTHAVLHDFYFGSDGFTPLGGLVSKGGVLYGTTVGGGANGGGSVFQLTPPAGGATAWSEVLLASLPASAAPEGTPAFGPGGLLYITTSGAGANGFGSVLSLKSPKGGAAPWTVSAVHDFAGGADGEMPVGGFTATGGTLYGTTTGGNDTAGTVFTITK